VIKQFWKDVIWGDIDYLLIDLPPGTGDAPLTVMQSIPVAGLIAVSSPQDLAVMVVKKALHMAQAMEVPVMGLVENMSFFCCPECGTRSDIFGHGGARLEAARLGVPLLAEVPLLRAVRQAADAGTPVVLAEPEGEAARAYTDLAAAVWRQLATVGEVTKAEAPPPPG
jgi:ATP-binding protein involved in chromosome partitioning